jgi:NodT family efflux transporter outer membrane factor (OMF) lipoprotein
MTLPDSLPLSLPSQLVEQRPDIRQAEETLHAATAQVGVAIAGMLPQVSLTANLGSEGLKSDQLFKSTFGLWGLGTNVTQTIFDGGALLHKRRAADAALEQAAAQYRSTVILAFQNVADSLRALQWDAESQKAAQASAAAARTAYDLARRQRDLGTISEVTLLNAEQTYQQAELALVQSRANRYSDSAGLLQALGGGWWNRPQEAEDARSGSSTR